MFITVSYCKIIWKYVMICDAFIWCLYSKIFIWWFLKFSKLLITRTIGKRKWGVRDWIIVIETFFCPEIESLPKYFPSWTLYRLKYCNHEIFLKLFDRFLVCLLVCLYFILFQVHNPSYEWPRRTTEFCVKNWQNI